MRTHAGADHLVADAERRDPGTHGFDHPGQCFAAHPQPRRAQAVAQADDARKAVHQAPVADVRAGRADTDEHLALAWYGPVDLREAQDVGVAVSILDDRLHRSSPGSGYWNTSSSATPNARAMRNAISSVGE